MNRLVSIDILRGFIMALMAIDHASAFIARVHFTEMWGVAFKGYPDIAWWFTRFISHLCAPGFFFLMGVSMVLFAYQKEQHSWSTNKIRYYFMKRAGIILLLMFFVEMPAWAFGSYFNEVRSSMNLPGLMEGSFLIPTSVLFGLSACMFIGAFLWRLKPLVLGLIFIVGFALSNFYIASSNPTEAFHVLEHIFLVPGMSDGILTLYPLIPWLGVMALGMIWAKLFIQYPSKIYTYSLVIGLLFISLFLAFRFSNAGNFQYNEYVTLIDFFTLIKYPPSITFIFCTMGINLILLGVFNTLHRMIWLKPLVIFGQTAMFFYLLHLYVYAIMGIAFPKGCDIKLFYVLWALGLGVLHFICQRFLQFKQQKPSNSLWRML